MLLVKVAVAVTVAVADERRGWRAASRRLPVVVVLEIERLLNNQTSMENYNLRGNIKRKRNREINCV